MTIHHPLRWLLVGAVLVLLPAALGTALALHKLDNILLKNNSQPSDRLREAV